MVSPNRQVVRKGRGKIFAQRVGTDKRQVQDVGAEVCEMLMDWKAKCVPKKL